MIHMTESSIKKLESSCIAEQLNKQLSRNSYKQGTWSSFRYWKLKFETQTLQVQHAYTNGLTKGDLSSLHWIEAPLSRIAFFTPEGEYESAFAESGKS